MYRVIKARQLFDGERFVPENAVVIKDNKIVEVVHISKEEEAQWEDIIIYDGILVPGFINTHCHLELSYLHQQFESGGGMIHFLHQMFDKRHNFSQQQIQEAITNWDKQMYNDGIVAVGDIVNSTNTLHIKKNSAIEYINFIEIFGLKNNNAEALFNQYLEVYNSFRNSGLKANVVPHSPYSLSQELWSKYRNFKDGSSVSIGSFHFMESRVERQLWDSHSSELMDYFISKFRYTLKELEHLFKNKREYLNFYLQKNDWSLLVHNTYLQEKDLDALSTYQDKIFFCLCPNANLFIENRLPNVLLIRSFTDKICLGTDSLASNYNLSIVDEMNVILKYFDVSTEDVLKWATSNGAAALGIQNKYGYIQKNYLASLNLIEIKDKRITLIETVHQD